MTIRVVLVDDHSRVHQVISEMLDFADDIELVGQAARGEEAVQLCDELMPDLVLMDVIMPGMGGAAATRQILEKHPDIKVLALSSFQDESSVREMLQSGAIGYVLKDSQIEDLENTIRTAHEGKSVLSAEVTRILLNGASATEDFGLSERELEVLRRMAAGDNNQQIALHLTISVSTVRFHISNILGKLEVDTRAEAIVKATRNKLV